VDIVIDDTPSEQKANDTVATTDNQENKEQAQSADVVMGDTLSEPKVNDATATIENQEPKESMEPKEQEEAVDQDIVMNDAPSEPKANDPIATAEIHELNEQGDTTALPDAVNSSDVMEISEDTKLEKTGNTAESVPTSEKTPPLDGTENGVLSSNDKTESASQIEKPTSKTPEATVLDNEANTEPKDSHQSPTDQPTDQPTATLNSTSTPPALNDTASSLQPPLTTAVSEEVTGDTIAATEENLLNSEAPAMENEPVPPPIRTVALRSLVTLNSFPNLSRHSTRIHHSPPHQDSPTVEKHTARSSRAQDRDVAHLLRAIFSVPPPSLDPNQAPPSSTDDSATATDNQKQPFAPYDPLIPASGGPRHSTRYLSKRATPCPITGSVARYRDPVTGLPYANAPAFRMLRAVAMDGHGVWSGLLQAWVGEDRRAKGVPSEVWEGTVELKAGDENGAADKEDGIKAK
jgi:vacuolar protein sorting-associated protein 72